MQASCVGQKILGINNTPRQVLYTEEAPSLVNVMVNQSTNLH